MKNKDFIVKDQNSLFDIKLNMIKYLDSIGVRTKNYVTFTKKEVYTALGMEKPTNKFNTAWNHLAQSSSHFMGYDADEKKWIWL